MGLHYPWLCTRCCCHHTIVLLNAAAPIVVDLVVLISLLIDWPLQGVVPNLPHPNLRLPCRHSFEVRLHSHHRRCHTHLFMNRTHPRFQKLLSDPKSATVEALASSSKATMDALAASSNATLDVFASSSQDLIGAFHRRFSSEDLPTAKSDSAELTTKMPSNNKTFNVSESRSVDELTAEELSTVVSKMDAGDKAVRELPPLHGLSTLEAYVEEAEAIVDQLENDADAAAMRVDAELNMALQQELGETPSHGAGHREPDSRELDCVVSTAAVGSGVGTGLPHNLSKDKAWTEGNSGAVEDTQVAETSSESACGMEALFSCRRSFRCCGGVEVQHLCSGTKEMVMETQARLVGTMKVIINA